MNDYNFFNSRKDVLVYLKKLYPFFLNRFPNDFDEYGQLEDINMFIYSKYYSTFDTFITEQNLKSSLLNYGIDLSDSFVFNNFFYYSMKLIKLNHGVKFDLVNESNLKEPEKNYFNVVVEYLTDARNVGFYDVPLSGFWYPEQAKNYFLWGVENDGSFRDIELFDRDFKVKDENLTDIWVATINNLKFKKNRDI